MKREPSRNEKKITRDLPRPWTEEEITSLKTLFPLFGVKGVHQRMGSRNQTSIRTKAEELQLKKLPRAKPKDIMQEKVKATPLPSSRDRLIVKGNVTIHRLL